MGEEELSGLDTSNLVGHLAAWNYFMSADTPENAEFIEQWHAFIGDDKRVTNDPMEAHYIGFNMWVQAVEQAGTTDVDAVSRRDDRADLPEPDRRHRRDAAEPPPDQTCADRRDPADGQFDIISQTDPVPGDAWTDFLPESAVLMSDWKDLKCGMYNTETKTCVQLTSNY